MLTYADRRPKNWLLRNMEIDDYSCLRPLLRFVSLEKRAVLNEPKRQIEHVVFIEEGIVSMRTISGGAMLETAMVGHRGAVGLSVALGIETALHQVAVSVGGYGYWLKVEDLRRSMQQRPTIRDYLLGSIHTLIIHHSQTALCCAKHAMEQRLACWLCLASDALGNSALPITHDHLSAALGLPRSGITQSLIRFENDGILKKQRGVIAILDKPRLARQACCCYGVITKGYHGEPRVPSHQIAI